METMDERTRKIIGEDGIQKLKSSRVVIIGLGGVGSYAAEACARSSLGELTLVDYDTISLSNINRQIYALNSTINCSKVDIAKRRISDINPECKVDAKDIFLTPENLNELNLSSANYVIDAVDNITAKIAIAKFCEEENIPHISVMGTANKTDPNSLVITDIYKTQNCPLAKAMRKLCRERDIKKLEVIYSTQLPVVKTTPVSSMIFVPATAGLLAAKEAVFNILNM